MIEYILDTDTCIYWLKGKEEVRRKVEKIGVDNLRITIITLAVCVHRVEYTKSERDASKKCRIFPVTVSRMAWISIQAPNRG